MKKNYILPILLIVFIILFFYGGKILSVFSPIFIGLILTYLSHPFVSFMSRFIPKVLSAILFYIIILSVIALLIFFVLPEILFGLKELINYLPTLTTKLKEVIPSISFPSDSILSYLTGKAENIVSFLSNILSLLFNFGFAIILSLFFLSDINVIKSSFSAFVPTKFYAPVRSFLLEADSIFKNFIRTQLLISLFLSLLSFVLFLIIGVRYALPLSLIYGIFCLIPTIGPFIGGVPVVLIAYISSPYTALLSLVAILITQVIDNLIISPKIKADSVDISPAAAFISIYLGGSFLGLLGVIFGVPLFATIKALIRRIISLFV